MKKSPSALPLGQTFVKKMLRQKRETTSLAIKKPNSGAKKLLSKKDFLWLRQQIEKELDLSIDQRHERIIQERKVDRQPSDGRAMRAGVEFTAQKKTPFAQERNNHKRAWYWRRVRKLIQSKLKFSDECGVNRAMTRLFGRAAKGVREVESVPRRLWTINGNYHSAEFIRG